jgi:hypothetical protein
MGTARQYLLSNRTIAPSVPNASFSECYGLLSASASVALKHQVTILQKAVKSAEDDRGGAPSSPACDPNYSGACVPIVSYDLNCDDVNGSYFQVVGYDKHGFDGDNDGIACEI